MFSAYFDASGTERNNPVLAVAGFLSSADRWIEFEAKWLERLEADALTCFHTSDFNACQGEFKSGWKGNENRRINLIADLVGIITDHVDRKFGVAIIVDSLGSFSKKQREEWPICAYSLAGMKVASMARQWAKTWGGPVPELIFEEGDKGRDKLEQALKENGFLTTKFRPKKDRIDKHGGVVKAAIPLQAADLMAYEVFDPMRKVHRDGRLAKLKRTLEELDKIPEPIGVIRTPYTQLLASLNELPHSQIIIPPPGYEQH